MPSFARKVAGIMRRYERFGVFFVGLAAAAALGMAGANYAIHHGGVENAALMEQAQAGGSPDADTCARLSAVGSQIIQNRDRGVSEAVEVASLKANTAIPANALLSVLDITRDAYTTNKDMDSVVAGAMLLQMCNMNFTPCLTPCYEPNTDGSCPVGRHPMGNGYCQ